MSVLDEVLLSFFDEPKDGWLYIGKNRINRLEFLRIVGSNRGRFKICKLVPGEHYRDDVLEAGVTPEKQVRQNC